MGKTINNNKAKRVLLTRQKIKEAQPEGKQSENTKRIIAESLVDQKKVRYRGKNRKTAVLKPAPEKSSQLKKAKTAAKAIPAAQLKEVAEVLTEARVKKMSDLPKATILKTAVMNKEQRNEVVKQDSDHFEYVLNCEEYKADPVAAVLQHLEDTMIPMREATGRRRYNPSSKRKLENDRKKKETAERSTSEAQTSQLSTFQNKLNNRSSPYPEKQSTNPGRFGKAAQKAGGKGRAAGGGSSKPWLMGSSARD